MAESLLQLFYEHLRARETRERSCGQVAVICFHNRPIAATQRIRAGIIVNVDVVSRAGRSPSITVARLKSALHVQSGVIPQTELCAAREYRPRKGEQDLPVSARQRDVKLVFHHLELFECHAVFAAAFGSGLAAFTK